jgi:hypothetical protein
MKIFFVCDENIFLKIFFLKIFFRVPSASHPTAALMRAHVYVVGSSTPKFISDCLCHWDVHGPVPVVAPTRVQSRTHRVPTWRPTASRPRPDCDVPSGRPGEPQRVPNELFIKVPSQRVPARPTASHRVPPRPTASHRVPTRPPIYSGSIYVVWYIYIYI